jgi:hypothetical protein
MGLNSSSLGGDYPPKMIKNLFYRDVFYVSACSALPVCLNAGFRVFLKPFCSYPNPGFYICTALAPFFSLSFALNPFISHILCRPFPLWPATS